MKKLKTITLLLYVGCGIIFTNGCLPNSDKSNNSNVVNYNPNIGSGKFKEMTLNEKLDNLLVEDGRKLYVSKCSSCHKLTDEKLVGPGWKGITLQRKPVWLMNFITNSDEMLSVDPSLREQLTIYSVKMPNLLINDSDARALLEFMRKNDETTN